MSNTTPPLLRVRDLKVHFTGRDAQRSTIKAVDGVSFDLAAGRTLALVGESGCGKSTTAYAIVGLEAATSGRIQFAGQDITRLPPKARRALATEIAIVFQDPTAALDPKMTVADSILEPLAIQGRSTAEQRRRLTELLDRVGLPAAYAARTPNALSGGSTVKTEKVDIAITQAGGALMHLPAGAKLADVVRALNTLGATPADLQAILQAMKTAGALNAELEVI